VLGLRWRDLDQEDGEIRIRQQIQRVDGELRIGPVKTAAARSRYSR
jgi:integrase